MKKYVLFTERRLVASVSSPRDAESIPYRSVTSFTTSNFITKDLKLRIADRRDELNLLFGDASDRDRAFGDSQLTRRLRC